MTSARGTSRGLYQNFLLTGDNCHQEPIHRPMAVQGHGYLMAFSLTTDLPVTELPFLHAISTNLAHKITREPAALWNQSPKTWLPPTLLQVLQNALAGKSYAESNGHTWHTDDQKFDVSYHVHNACLIIECEPEPETSVHEHLVRQSASLMQTCSTLEKLHQTVCAIIGKAFEYDRVMVYQFDEDKHGIVVGEFKQENQAPFLGLHFPESDIPKIARDLFLRAKSRLISDTHIENTFLLFNPALGSPPPSLDLSYSQLRATSPIHIEYLGNMGVRASLTLGIVIGGELWGLIACHHAETKQVMFRHRLIGEAIAELFGKKILELQIAEHENQLQRALNAESELMDRIRISDHYRIEILEQTDTLKRLCPCDGIALITLDECAWSEGRLPSLAQLFALRDWLVETDVSHLYHTTNVPEDIPIAFEPVSVVGGVLAVCLSTISNSYLIWFRQPVTQFVNWGGNSENSYSVENIPGSDEVRVSPRQSFAKWRQAVKGQSLPWTNADILRADRLRDVVFKKELLRTANLVQRSNVEFTSLTFATAHDLQEPLRTLINYTHLLREQDEDSDYCIGRIENATRRMQGLITDLLDYANLGTESTPGDVNLSQLMKEIVYDLGDLISDRGAIVAVAPLPTVRGDANRIKQMLINFLTNAIKYVPKNTPPEVQFTAENDGNFVVVKVRDNGIGIDKKYQDQIFQMFKRLHNKNEFEGSGIGLAICKKVADTHEFEIGVNSEPGAGATFWLKIHSSMITPN